MSKAGRVPAGLNLADALALELQSLCQRHRIDAEPGLLRIDFRRQAARAPFQFDMVNGKLHRADCPGIPLDSRSALYAVWSPKPGSEDRFCTICRPSAGQGTYMAKNMASDLMYGLLSILDQFGSVIGERGKEYRESERGRELAQQMDKIFAKLDETQQQAVSLALASLDGLIQLTQMYNASFAQGNGSGRNGGNGRSPKAASRRPRQKKNPPE